MTEQEKPVYCLMIDSEVFERFFHIIRCETCGAILTSPRSRRYGKGQRCRWATEGFMRKRSTHVNQGMPIDDVAYTISGGKGYVRKLWEAFE